MNKTTCDQKFKTAQQRHSHYIILKCIQIHFYSISEMWYEGVSVFFHAGLVGLNLSKIPINSEKTIWYVASPDNLAILEVIGKSHLSSTSSSHNHLQAPLFNTSRFYTRLWDQYTLIYFVLFLFILNKISHFQIFLCTLPAFIYSSSPLNSPSHP